MATNTNANSGPTNQKKQVPKKKKVVKKKQPQSTQLSRIDKAPIAQVKSVKVNSPQIRRLENGDFVIRNREFIATITSGAGGFVQVKRLRVNPGSENTFGWLSGIARSFEMYRFNKLKFEYLTRAPATLPGTVLMVPDYDAADGNLPLNERDVCANVHTVEFAVWKNKDCVLSTTFLNKAFKAHFTMDDGRFEATKQDQKTIDSAQLYVFTDLDNNSVCGKLWVDYEVVLMTPQKPTDSVNQGGAGMRKDGSLNLASTNIFQNNTVGTAIQETQPILELLPSIDFPGAHLFKVARQWKGYLDTRLGTGGGGSILDGGMPKINGAAVNTIPGWTNTIGAIQSPAGTLSTQQWKGTLNEGDLLGFMPVTLAGAGTLDNIIFNLGGFSLV